MLATLSLWGVAGLQVFERHCFWRCPSWSYSLAATALYGLASLTLRECWHVVRGAQMLMMVQRSIRRMNRRDGAT
jgi:hypothetical protein